MALLTGDLGPDSPSTPGSWLPCVPASRLPRPSIPRPVPPDVRSAAVLP